MADIKFTVGMDISDRHSHLCFLDRDGEVVRRAKVPTTEAGLQKALGKVAPSLIALEACGHSPWISRLLRELGHQALVANPRQLQLISQSNTKNDSNDAELLARIARADRKLLKPVQHRSRTAQLDLTVIQVRKSLIAARSRQINAVRGIAKSHGFRVRTCSAESFHRIAETAFPAELRGEIQPLLDTVKELTQRIREQDSRIEKLLGKYPVAERLTEVQGVGPVTAVSFVLTLDDEKRFARSRSVGAFVGLCPKQDQSGKSDKQLRITKAGDRELRTLLVNCAQSILREGTADSDLKRWGLKLASRGGKNAKKRAAVAVARKLAVLLHHLWVTGKKYEPLIQDKRAA